METRTSRSMLRTKVRIKRDEEQSVAGEDAPWLNDVKAIPPVEASPSFVGVERLETVPLTYLTGAKALSTMKVEPKIQGEVAKAVSEESPLPTSPTSIEYYSKHEMLGEDHPLWPLLCHISERLWRELYRAEKAITSTFPTEEQLRQRFIELLRAEPQAARVVQSIADAELLLQAVKREVIGFGPLEPLLQDEQIAEIAVYGLHKVMIKHSNTTRTVANLFVDEQHLLRIIENMLRHADQQLRPENSLFDVTLSPHLHATILLPPLSLNGPVLILRKRVAVRPTLTQLVEQAVLSQQMADMLQKCVQERWNIFIIGAQESGKTILLNALCMLLPDHKRIVSVEHVPELIFSQRGIISLVSSDNPSVSPLKATHATFNEILQGISFLKPEYLIIGDCQSYEQGVLLQKIHNGQQGVITTLYASSLQQGLDHLVQHYQSNSMNVTVEMSYKYTAQALDLLVFLSKLNDGSYKVTNIAEVVGVMKQRIKIRSLFYYQQSSREQDEKNRSGAFVATGLDANYPSSLMKNTCSILL